MARVRVQECRHCHSEVGAPDGRRIINAGYGDLGIRQKKSGGSSIMICTAEVHLKRPFYLTSQNLFCGAFVYKPALA